MRVGRKSLEGCVPVRVNRLKEILRSKRAEIKRLRPTRKRQVRRRITDFERRTSYYTVVEQNVTSPVQLRVTGVNRGVIKISNSPAPHPAATIFGPLS